MDIMVSIQLWLKQHPIQDMVWYGVMQQGQKEEGEGEGDEKRGMGRTEGRRGGTEGRNRGRDIVSDKLVNIVACWYALWNIPVRHCDIVKHTAHYFSTRYHYRVKAITQHPKKAISSNNATSKTFQLWGPSYMTKSQQCSSSKYITAQPD